MRLIVAAVGRLGRGPERDAIATLTARIEGLSKTTRLGPLTLCEIEDKTRRGTGAEAALLLKAGAAERRVALDERGKSLTSLAFADRLRDWRDAGAPDVAFFIGGADGHDPSVRDAADLVLSLGAMTWPHALARVMLVEQIYRASTILAGHPYHREG